MFSLVSRKFLAMCNIALYSVPKNLGTLKTNFEEADGLGIRLQDEVGRKEVFL